MKTYYTFVNDHFIDRVGLFRRISNVKKWLYIKNGLDLMNIMDDILEPYKSKLTPIEINNFNVGLDILKKTDFPISEINYKLRTKSPNGIENVKLIKDSNGNWSPINKLNTSIYGLSHMLVFLIEKLMKDKSKIVSEFGKTVYDTIISNDVQGGLLMLKTKEGEKEGLRLKNIIKRYILEDDVNNFMVFTENIVVNSQLGDVTEKRVAKYFKDLGFDIVYIGGDGDFIDMYFGCDIIIYKEDIGYKTIQIKSYQPSTEDIKRYKVDWLVFPISNIMKVIDTQTNNTIYL